MYCWKRAPEKLYNLYEATLLVNRNVCVSTRTWVFYSLLPWRCSSVRDHNSEDLSRRVVLQFPLWRAKLWGDFLLVSKVHFQRYSRLPHLPWGLKWSWGLPFMPETKAFHSWSLGAFSPHHHSDSCFITPVLSLSFSRIKACVFLNNLCGYMSLPFLFFFKNWWGKGHKVWWHTPVI